MKLITQTPKKALKAFLKQKPLRSEIDIFKTNLIILLNKISLIEKRPIDESEEHLKNDLRDFLRDTYYRETNAINTKDKKDLVIHIDKSTNSDVGVIIEAKRPSNVGEMVSVNNPNKKAFHELILYYLDERNKVGNFQLKQLLITNINEWYIIDANQFDKHIYNNKQIQNLYKTKVNDNKNNPFFYQEIEKLIAKIDAEISCVYFDIREYDIILRNNKKEDDRELIALFKILSPQHLLKIATPNDSNSLDEKFYKELLHIIGLEEAREGTKNVIRRKNTNRNAASLIELTIDAITTEDLLYKLPDQAVYGASKEERLFNVGLELCITWINRILFLKLLEGQLITYHKTSSGAYRFLNSEMIHSFDELFKLFHKVLAVNLADRTEAIKSKYSKVPYLNSSLFEISELEDQTLRINSLDNDGKLELIKGSIIASSLSGKVGVGTLDYLFKFLDAYDFASEGTEDVQEDNKTLITASVLGKVFEKINGYKDGSIFTPAFITMYMCKQSIRLAVVEKFLPYFNTDAFAPSDGIGAKALVKSENSVKDIYELIGSKVSRKQANEIINTLKICDPAVGSGHFLVSALNEIIAIKSELGILMDEYGKTLRDYEIEIVNDELIITDENGNIFAYNPANAESNRVQKTLFHEKQTIIENCLFGVDINPNSVKICRLRLWIELLKNAYYRESMPSLGAKASVTQYGNNSSPFGGGWVGELETLPNIDINIKCGNSLLSRFTLDADLSKALKSIKYNITAYRGFVNDYKNEKSREVKRGLQQIINGIKNDFKTEINNNDPKIKKLAKLQYELNMLVAPSIFKNMVNEDMAEYGTKENIKKAKDRQNKLETEVNKLAKEIEDIKNNKIFTNAFEWRFEFPEVMNNEGGFEGFDLIIGNPPYIKEYENRDAFNGLRNLECYQGKMDIWYLFGHLGLNLLKPNGNLCYIATNNWVTNAGALNFRNIIINNSQIVNLIDFGAFMVFENAAIQTMIMLFKNNKEANNYTFDYRKLESEKPNLENVFNLLNGFETSNTVLLSPTVSKENLTGKPLTFNTDENSELLNKIKGKKNFTLREKADKKLRIQSELGQGIVAPQDFINKTSAETLKHKFQNGEGIFVLSQAEFESKQFLAKEKKIIKPYFTTNQLERYFGSSKNTHWLIYTKSDINKPDKLTRKIPLTNFPNIKEHLDNFISVITSDFAPYGLHRAREQYFFEGEKIMVTRKCPKQPIFTYTDFDCFVSQTFFVIQSTRINLKYLTGLLNSKLIAFWLRKKGKMQGNNYQLDKEPLLEIPIYNPTKHEANNITALVDKIISQKQKGEDTKDYENQIDKLVYQLYDITEDEQKLIENK